MFGHSRPIFKICTFLSVIKREERTCFLFIILFWYQLEKSNITWLNSYTLIGVNNHWYKNAKIHGHSTRISTRKTAEMRVCDRLWYPLSILLLAAIGVKLIGPHGGLQVDKQKASQVTGSVDSPYTQVKKSSSLTQYTVLSLLI